MTCALIVAHGNSWKQWVVVYLPSFSSMHSFMTFKTSLMKQVSVSDFELDTGRQNCSVVPDWVEPRAERVKAPPFWCLRNFTCEGGITLFCPSSASLPWHALWTLSVAAFVFQTNRFIDVEFSCLDTTINLQTWVVLLDFLGMGATVHHNPQDTAPEDTAPHAENGDRAQASQLTPPAGRVSSFILLRPWATFEQGVQLQGHLKAIGFRNRWQFKRGGLNRNRWQYKRCGFIRVVSHQGGVSSGWCLIRVVFHHGGVSSGWHLIRVVFHQGGISSGWYISSRWCLIRVAYLIRVVSCQGGLSSWVSLYSSACLLVCLLDGWVDFKISFYRCFVIDTCLFQRVVMKWSTQKSSSAWRASPSSWTSQSMNWLGWRLATWRLRSPCVTATWQCPVSWAASPCWTSRPTAPSTPRDLCPWENRSCSSSSSSESVSVFPALQDINYHVSVFVTGWGGVGVGARGGMGGLQGSVWGGGGQLGGKGVGQFLTCIISSVFIVVVACVFWGGGGQFLTCIIS